MLYFTFTLSFLLRFSDYEVLHFYSTSCCGFQIAKYEEVVEELSTLEKKLAEAEWMKHEAETRTEEDDDLDSFMRNLKRQVPDKHKRVNWKVSLGIAALSPPMKLGFHFL